MSEPQTEKWDLFEIRLAGSGDGNPFLDTKLRAEFVHENEAFSVEGFYDGRGDYRIRFMPAHEGSWTYHVFSNVADFDGITGCFTCGPASATNHGPVRVADTFHFSYADGARFSNIGTTCYGWIHQSDELVQETLRSLKNAPFNKLRMMLFPKHYKYNYVDPPADAFEGGPPSRGGDLTRLNPDYFRRVESGIIALRDLGIEADLIFFTAYDFNRWGYDTLPPEVDDRLIRYVVNRFAAFRNVWWSIANEYDLIENKTEADWDRYFQIIKATDPYNHLRSNHQNKKYYDHHKPWVSHCSIQNSNTELANRFRKEYQKPVVFDECCYEGDISPTWGNLTAEELVRRFWMGFLNGGYVGHGETYLNDEEILWWSKGGSLRGQSPERIAFLREVVEATPVRLDPIELGEDNIACAGVEKVFYLHYLGPTQPRFRELHLPDDRDYFIEILDTWNMAVIPVPGTYCGDVTVSLPGRPYIAIRIQQITSGARS